MAKDRHSYYFQVYYGFPFFEGYIINSVHDSRLQNLQSSRKSATETNYLKEDMDIIKTDMEFVMKSIKRKVDIEEFSAWKNESLHLNPKLDEIKIFYLFF